METGSGFRFRFLPDMFTVHAAEELLKSNKASPCSVTIIRSMVTGYIHVTQIIVPRFNFAHQRSNSSTFFTDIF